MEMLLLFNLGFAGMMCGVFWTVQLAVYPLFRDIPPPAFVAYHERYTRWISVLVVPVMLLEAGFALWLAWLALPGWSEHKIIFLSLILLAIVWGSTFFLQVPQHQRLAEGFDRQTHFLLVRTNWLRTSAASLRVALLILAISLEH